MGSPTTMPHFFRFFFKRQFIRFVFVMWVGFVSAIGVALFVIIKNNPDFAQQIAEALIR
jgi:hypothetical protein